MRILWRWVTITIFFPVLIGLLALVPFASIKRSPVRLEYRDQPYASAACAYLRDHPNALRMSRDSAGRDNVEGLIPESAWRCMIQTHADVAAANAIVGSPPNGKGVYTLGFVEFDEAGEQIDPAQLRALLDHLRGLKHNYLVTYIHGWRYDARRDGEDVRRFRQLLAFAKAFIELRCKQVARYCDVGVTGLYLGWRGAETAVDDDRVFTTAGVLPTLLTRKRVSERIAPSVVRVLTTISDEMRAKSATVQDFFAKDKMLVLGHSLGGNVLATGLHDAFVSSLTTHRPGTTLVPPVGDLVVIFNPAAEAWKWTDIQRKVIETLAHQAPSVANGTGFYSTLQRPIYIAATSACQFPAAEAAQRDLKGRPVLCDLATGRYFPLFKMATLNWQRESRTAIGHLYPEGETGDAAVGQTHDLDMNGAIHRRTTYDLASDPRYSQCRVVDGWLTSAKTRHPGKGWDAGYAATADDKNINLAVDPINDAVYNEIPFDDLDEDQRKFASDLRVNAQFRHGAARGFGPTITLPDDPFWNVRALDTAVSEHGGFFGFSTWCAFNQLVLDDVTAAPSTALKDIWRQPLGTAPHASMVPSSPALSPKSAGDAAKVKIGN